MLTKPLVLIVDDNSINLRLSKTILEKRGYEVITAKSADEVLVVLDSHVPGVILMDIQLPGTDGLKLTGMLKAMPAIKHVPIVALTAFASKQDKERALAAGCDGFIAKPYDIQHLPQVVQEYLDGKK